MSDPVTRFLDAVTAGTGVPEDLFTADAVLDATIPGFRFAQHGPERIAGQMSSWYADPGSFAEVSRVPMSRGELVRFDLLWQEEGQTMAARQVHVIELADGRISRQEMWCGGRWDPTVQAEIAAAL
jgi:hypothetical protein